MEHPIEKIAQNPQGYKYCKECRKINWNVNKCCHGCGHRQFNRMDDEDGRFLLLDWEKEPEFMVGV